MGPDSTSHFLAGSESSLHLLLGSDSSPHLGEWIWMDLYSFLIFWEDCMYSLLTFLLTPNPLVTCWFTECIASSSLGPVFFPYPLVSTWIQPNLLLDLIPLSPSEWIWIISSLSDSTCIISSPPPLIGSESSPHLFIGLVFLSLPFRQDPNLLITWRFFLYLNPLLIQILTYATIETRDCDCPCWLLKLGWMGTR